MSELLNPGFWKELTGPVILMIVAAMFVWALATERLVLGRQYRAAVARAEKTEDANRDLTGALIEKNAGEEAARAILTAIRKELSARET